MPGGDLAIRKGVFPTQDKGGFQLYVSNQMQLMSK